MTALAKVLDCVCKVCVRLPKLTAELRLDVRVLYNEFGSVAYVTKSPCRGILTDVLATN